MPELTAEVKVEATIEFEVVCGRCGGGLCRNTTTDTIRGKQIVTVDPCEKRLSGAHDEGYEEGRMESA